MPAEKNKKPAADHIVAAPLLCWDIFMSGYQHLKIMADDLQQLKHMSRRFAWQPAAWDLEEKFLQQRKVALVTDSSQHIVFASNNIIQLNGYRPSELIGKSPKIFQGPDTDALSRAIVRDAVKEQRPFHVHLLNYKKNQAPYYCDIEGFPVFNRQKKMVHFIAFETLLDDH